MVTVEEVKAAGEKARDALVALRRYAENPESRKDDAILHGRLVIGVRESIEKYLRLVSELKP
jgi:hypothetical protein